MLARCARCQATFTTDRFGRQTCPHCGAELLLADPGAPPPAPAEPAPPAAPPAAEPPPPPASAPASGPPEPGGPVWGAPPPPPSGGELPPPPPPPPGGYGAPPPAWGPPPSPGAPGGLGPPPPPPPTPSGPELAAPFAERAQRGVLSAYFETWKLAAIEPARFFRQVRVDQPGSAVLFAVISYAFGVAVQSLFNWLSGQQMVAMMEQLAGRMPPGQAEIIRNFVQRGTGAIVLGEVLLAPLLALVALYVAAGAIHLLLVLFGGARRGFPATLTTVGYTFGVFALLAVPGCGGLVAPIWWLVAVVIGLSEAQRCGTGRAAAAVLTPAVLLCVCCCLGPLGMLLGGALGGLSDLGHGPAIDL
ncbi:YIP1 family protein [Anaeromyxobacter sp. Red801]|uniref:YIP1 family protein n=1 Tax=Anaeromyxobacter sp. Red801 TaxID=3411632 RepID=UPI003BA2B922